MLNDKTYAFHRDKLIPEAVRHANELHGDHPTFLERPIWGAIWDRTYLKKMDDLAIEAGLTHIRIESEEDRDNEIKELMLLQDPICGKHHG